MDRISLDNVELRIAYSWTCPECGVDQFERSIAAEMSPEDLEEMRTEHGAQPWETGHFVTSPKSVTCRECNRTFNTEEYASEEDDY